MSYIVCSDALDFLKSIPDDSVDLVLTDPPYYGIVKDSWDNAWPSAALYSDWLATIMKESIRILNKKGSMVIFQGIGSHGEHPIFRCVTDAESIGFKFRNWITWQKKRAFGKSHDYLFCREEILWFSKSHERTEVTFNIPLLEEKRGYKGWNPKYPAKSEHKRVNNVFTDIPEIFRPERVCQKPEALIERLINTHSNPGDLIVDPFVGYGTTGIVAAKLNRKFQGCEAIEKDAISAEERIKKAGQTVQL